MDAADRGGGALALAFALQGQSPFKGHLVTPFRRLVPAAAAWAGEEGR